jgi:UDP-N-acetylglucosamine--N-acetylmuramyl-(pentapeptide) pyrophosphoryl-undecaprenol N-acetylglucosamine transferase
MHIVMTGGGTGGHLAIIRAVKEQLVEKSGTDGSGSICGTAVPELVYIGSTQGQDRRWFAADEAFSATHFLETRGVVNQRGAGKLLSLWMLFKAFLQARTLLKRYEASVVFSVGGFSSAATVFAAKSMGIPLIIHEQNAAMGALNRLFRPYAAAFISAYLEESPVKAYPVKEIFFEQARVRKTVKTLLFLGGSQGAKAINTLALSMAPELARRGIRILHQAGEKNIEEVSGAYAALGVEAEVFGFTTALADLMQRADFAIARAGASTLWELSATALPALFIPYPYAAGDHQYHNARFLVEQNLAWMMREEEANASKVLALLDENLEAKSRGLMACIERGGSRQIAEYICQYATLHK